MTADVTRLLDAMQARCDAATEGPWEADDTEVSQHWSAPEPWKTVASNEVVCMPYCYGGSGRGVERKEDAEFIAAARQDLPRLIAAARAVLELHRREIRGGSHDPHWICIRCSATRWVAWPCPTVTAITTALEAS